MPLILYLTHTKHPNGFKMAVERLKSEKYLNAKPNAWNRLGHRKIHRLCGCEWDQIYKLNLHHRKISSQIQISAATQKLAYSCLFIPLYLFETIKPMERIEKKSKTAPRMAATQTTENETPSANRKRIYNSLRPLKRSSANISYTIIIWFSLREFIGMNSVFIEHKDYTRLWISEKSTKYHRKGNDEPG